MTSSEPAATTFASARAIVIDFETPESLVAWLGSVDSSADTRVAAEWSIEPLSPACHLTATYMCRSTLPRGSHVRWGNGVEMRDGLAAVAIHRDPPFESGSAGLAFRVRDERNHYVAYVDAAARLLVVACVRDAALRELARAAIDVGNGSGGRLSVLCAGDAFDVRWNEQSIARVVDATFERGGIGLWVRGELSAKFDDLEIRPTDLVERVAH